MRLASLFISDSSNGRIREVDGTTGLISTRAGNGLVGRSGDSGPATSASLSNPTGIALDPAGNIYFSDNGNNVIRRIDAFSGVITTVVGTSGAHGYSGDHGPATLATLNAPNGLCFDVLGNLLIADTGNNVIRMVTPSGVISTIAGTGAAAYSGDGGPASAATFNQPWGVTVSPPGVLYIADQANHAIRAVSNTGAIATIAGNGTPGFSGDQGAATLAQLTAPSSVAVDVAATSTSPTPATTVCAKSTR